MNPIFLESRRQIATEYERAGSSGQPGAPTSRSDCASWTVFHSAKVFTFLSALYFRGKLAYARAFARPPASAEGVLIITPTAGLLPPDTLVRLSRLRGFSRVPINVKNKLSRCVAVRSKETRQ